MPKQLAYDLSLPAAEVIDRLKDETVPFEGVLNLGSPLRSYGTFLKESFTGTKNVLAKIDGQHFRLMTIGFWPFKGASPLANVGAMHGAVQDSDTGSRVQAQFKIFPIWLVLMVLMLCLCAFAAAIAILVAILGAQMEFVARVVIWAICGAFGVFSLFFVLYILVGARNQEIVIRKFLDDFVTRIAVVIQ